MITLIAESKTMDSNEQHISEENLREHTPMFEKEASEIISNLLPLPIEELAMRLSVSQALAIKTHKMMYEFPNKLMGYPALYGFTGEVFRGLDINSISEEAKDFGKTSLLFISSLYGLLKPEDIIKPYRLDFNVDCAPDGSKLSTYWKKKLTIALVKHIKSNNENEILDLLPGEASKCLDWKLIKNFAKVVKIDFKYISDKGELKTPHAGKLKELRGKMVREILCQKINDLRTLINLKTADFASDPDLYRPGYPVFVALQ